MHWTASRCPLAAQRTTAKDGRSVYAGPYEEQLARARARQRDPDWTAGYRPRNLGDERQPSQATTRQDPHRRSCGPTSDRNRRAPGRHRGSGSRAGPRPAA